MAYDYNKSKKLYEQMNEQQQQQFAQQNKNDPNYQQFMNDYTNDANRVNKVSTPAVTSPYQNQGAGNYSYSQQTGYYEKAPGNYQNQGEGQYVYDNKTGYYQNTTKPQTNQYTDYSNYNNTNNQNFYGNQNNVNNTGNVAGTTTPTGTTTGATNLTGNTSYNYTGSFDEAINNKLKSAYGINSLDEFKQRYPEQYESLVQSLESVRGVRDATDPERRALLEGQLQGIIGSGVGAGSDWSKLNLLENTIMNKFQDGDRVKQDMQNIVKLQTEGKSIEEIARQMGISPDQVQQSILAYNGLDNKLGEYYKLKSDVASDITEPFDKKMDRAEIEKNIALERANRQVERLKEDFDTAMERQQKANEVNLHNADFISGQYGYGFSKRGIEGLQYTAQQAQNIIDDLVKNYDRNNQQLADGIADIIRNWERYNDDLMEASEDALTEAKNVYTSNMLKVQQQYGTVGLQAQQALSQNVQNFITQAESIYDNALNRQQQNLSNLITNASNLNALSMQNLTLRQAKIQQFQSEALTMNRNQLQQLANQLGMSKEEFGDLANYQVQAVANELNGYLPGAGVQFQGQIQNLLNQGYTPQEAMSSIMNSEEFKAMQSVGGSSEWTKLNDNIIFDKNSGQYIEIGGNGGMNGTNGNGGLYQFSESEVRTGDTIGNDINSIGHILESEDGLRIGTYKSSNGYTYNVYANREDGIKATENLLKRGYYGMTLGDAAQKWIGKGKDISAAKKVIQNKGLSLDAKLSDENVRKFIEAMGTWEGTLKKGQTLDDWANGGRGLGGYSSQGSSEGGNNMSDYDINTAVMKIGRQAYGANISNAESERVEKVIKDGTNMGKSQTEILYDVLGMKITNNKDKAEPFIDIMVQNSDKDGLSAYNTEGFANFINKGKYVEAMNLVEQAVAKERGGNFASDMAKYEKGAKYLYTKGDDIINLINNQTNKLGIVAGNFEKKWTKFVKDEEFQTLKSSLANLVADWRHDMIGSAATETELKMLEDLIPTVTDNPYNAIAKIQELQDKWLRDYNGTRGSLYLPSVTKDTLLDKDKRAELYFGGDVSGDGNTVFKGSFDLSKYGRS